MDIVLWIVALLAVLVDNVFGTYFWLSPLYFYLESLLVRLDLTKLIRLIVFSFLFQSFMYRELNVIWAVATFIIVVIEIYRDYFYHHWVASVFQFAVFALPHIETRAFPIAYGFLISSALFAYVQKRLAEED